MVWRWQAYWLTPDGLRYLMPSLSRSALVVFDIDYSPAEDGLFPDSFFEYFNDNNSVITLNSWNHYQLIATKHVLQCIVLQHEFKQKCPVVSKSWLTISDDPEWLELLSGPNWKS